MIKTKLFFIALLAILAPATLPAATLVEGIDYVDAPLVDLGTVGGGSHTISGQMNGTCLGAAAPFSCLFGADPQDAFTIEIASGLELLGFSITFASVQQQATDFGHSFTFSSPAESFTFSSLADGAYVVGGITQTSGILTFVLSGDDSDVNNAWSSDWTVQLTVSQVPIPAAFGLLACGLMGLGVLGRRRKSV